MEYPEPMLTLYSYFRSSAAYRVRIALNLKGLEYRTLAVHLVRDGGENNHPEYLARNPQGLVPTLVTGDGSNLVQSLAIMEYLEELYPQPALLPKEPIRRARARAIAQAIACEVHPLNNLRVLQYLERELSFDEAARLDWYRHWIADGLAPIEKMLTDSPETGPYCLGDRPGLADCCLVPQIYNARRFECPLDAFPRMLEIEQACLELDAFRQATPEAQPDAT